jgi:hypothetical protein
MVEFAKGELRGHWLCNSDTYRDNIPCEQFTVKQHAKQTQP